MPYTVAHPAAALLLERVLRGRVTFSALVIGSLVPDLAYLMPFLPAAIRGFAHRPLSLVLFCVPAGVALWAIFESLLREPLLALLPDRLQTRLQRRSQPLRQVRWATVVLSVFLGAASHQLWDAFTHEGSWLVKNVEVLRTPLFQVGGDVVRMNRFLQHTSTVLGLAVLAAWIGIAYLQTPAARDAPPAAGRLRVWTALVFAAGAWVLARALPLYSSPLEALALRRMVAVAGLEALRAMAFLVLAWAVVWHLGRRAQWTWIRAPLASRPRCDPAGNAVVGRRHERPA